jgi:MFS family permease
MVVLYLIGAAISGDTQGFAAAGADLPGSMLVFFFLGLSALAVARLSTIWEAGRPDERGQVPGRAWLALVVGIAGGILLLASMMAGLAAADIAKYLLIALRPLMPVVEMLFVVVFFVAGLIVRVLVAILTQLPRRPPHEIAQPPTVIDDLLRRLREFEVNRQFVEGARWGMALLLLALLLIGMAVTIVLIRRRERKRDDDERESVWSTRDALAELTGWLRRLWVRRLAQDAPPPEVNAIRLIYRALLDLGATLGAPRKTWATPREHLSPLGGALPAVRSEIESLTAAYERVRYGRWRPTASDVRAAEAALVRVRATRGPAASSEERSG